jgi:hypothetical protein
MTKGCQELFRFFEIKGQIAAIRTIENSVLVSDLCWLGERSRPLRRPA